MSINSSNAALGAHFFNRITFSIPIETFKIDFYITEDKRESVVTEFILRLIYIAGSLEIDTLMTFFGFSDSEAISVLDGLKNRGLIELFESKILLSPYSKSAFASSKNDSPSFAKVEPRSENITFDLLSISPLPTPKTRSAQNGIAISLPPEIQGNSIELAKHSFHNRFEDVLSVIYPNNSKRPSLYCLDDIESRRRSFLNIPIAFGIDQNGKIIRLLDPKLSNTLPSEFIDIFEEKVSNELGEKNRPSGLDELESFINIFKCNFLDKYISGNNFDFRKYMSDIDAAIIDHPEGIDPIYGSLYLQQNFNKIINEITLLKNLKPEKKLHTSSIWLSPDDKFWGRGDLIEKSFSALNEVLVSNEKNSAFLFARSNPGDEAAILNRFRGSHINELHLYKPVVTEGTALLQNLELFLYPNGFMASLIHLSSPENPNIKIPIGFISKQSKHCEYCKTFISSIINSTRYIGRPNFDGKNTIDKVDTTDVFNFLINS